jgi:adenine specific DNA methylase mod
LALNHAYILVYAKNTAKEMHSLKWRTAQSEEYLKRYKELDPDGKRLWNCIISRGKMKEIFNLDNKNMFDELLDSISSAFEYWRYIYEKDNGFININF